MSDIDYDAVIEKLNRERADRINLAYTDRPHGMLKGWLSWDDSENGRVSREVPMGLDLAGQLAFVDTWENGFEYGKDAGRERLQSELRSLIGAAKDE